MSLLSLFPSKKQRKELKANSSAKIPTFNGTKGKVFDDYLMDFKSVVQSRGLPDYTKGWVLNTIHVPMDAEGASITQFKLNMPDHPHHGKVLRKSELSTYNKWVLNNKIMDKAIVGEIKNALTGIKR